MNNFQAQLASPESSDQSDPKRVLLFEPGSAGHRTTILRYVKKVLRQEGIEAITRTSAPKINRFALPGWLAQEAQQEGAELIHILTFDSLLAEFIPATFSWGAKFPIVATHYQYSNFKHGIRKSAFRMLLRSQVICRFLVSDPMLHEYPVALREQMSFLPDPWDPDDFPEFALHQARHELGVAGNAIVFLVFGDLSERKGISTILAAFAACGTLDHALLLLAGVPSPECLSQLQQLPVQTRSRIKRHFCFIPEEEVSRYFYAADFVLSSYPSWFVVSSGTFTRACASGKPMIAASHGVVGTDIEQRQIGLTHKPESVEGLIDNLKTAYAAAKTSQYEEWSQGAKHVGLERTLPIYGSALTGAYRLALSTVKSR